MEYSGAITIHGTEAKWACGQPGCSFFGKTDRHNLADSVKEAKSFLLDHYYYIHKDVKGKRVFALNIQGVVTA